MSINSDQSSTFGGASTTGLVDSIQLAKEIRNSQMYGSVESTDFIKTEVTSESGVFTLDDFDQFPVYATCPTCHRRVLTHIKYEVGVLTWIMCGLLFLLGCWCGCFLIPCFVSIFKDVKHVCPDCQTHLGFYKRGRGY